MTPTKEQATHFALMLSAGMPAVEAIQYFLPEGSLPLDGQKWAKKWQSSKSVNDAILLIQGKPWQDMSPLEKIQFAIDKHYTEMAYFLYSRNYVELTSSEQIKADTCRKTLEAKLAGTSGQATGLDAFLGDVIAGKVKLPSIKVQ